jgi:hypothetical protein
MKEGKTFKGIPDGYELSDKEELEENFNCSENDYPA